MIVKQIANILNTVFAETIGESAQFNEDLSNFVDVGTQITGTIDLNDQKFVEQIFGKLIDRIGQTYIDSKAYTAKDWGIYKDSWEYGSILQKIRVEVGEFHDNPVWDLRNYEPHVWDYEAPDCTAKYFNSKTTYEAILCTTTKQLKEAFTSASKMNEFLSALETRVKTKMEFSKEQLARRTITNLIAEKLKSEKNVVHLITNYKNDTGKTVTAATAMYDRDFLEYFAREMMEYKEHIAEFTQLYNNDEYATYTSDPHIIVQSKLDTGLSTTLPANTYNEKFVKIPNYRTINYWQSPDLRMKINVIPASEGSYTGNPEQDTRKKVVQDNIAAVMFDDKAAMITNAEPYTDTIYNPEGRFYKTWYRYDSSYFNDLGENAIVFVLD